MGSQNRLIWLLKRLKVVRKMSLTPVVIEQYRAIEHEIRCLRQQHETVAWQRCRPFVLKDGDKNTTYFHSKVSMRRRRNKLKGLVDSYGVKQTSIEGMQRVVWEYFSKLFDTSRPEITTDEVNFIKKRVTDDMAAKMIRPYNRAEIEEVLSEMHPCKSPGPDGLLAL